MQNRVSPVSTGETDETVPTVMSAEIRQKKGHNRWVESPKLSQTMPLLSGKVSRSRQVPILSYHIFSNEF